MREELGFDEYPLLKKCLWLSVGDEFCTLYRVTEETAIKCFWEEEMAISHIKYSALDKATLTHRQAIKVMCEARADDDLFPNTHFNKYFKKPRVLHEAKCEKKYKELTEKHPLTR